ncbi:MAG: AAA family ATPase [Thermoplasmata archaeon]|nr:MAG: AAA family ATPase [Thermoplasmata archaeon]
MPRAMNRLKKMDYVFERLSHIEGKTRRQKAYFLTEEGMLSARNLRERVMDWDVFLKNVDGQIVKMKLFKVNSSLKTQFSPLRLVMSLSDEDIIHASSLLQDVEDEPVRKAPAQFFVAGEISWPKEFIGREKERAKISKWLSGNEPNTVVIYGSIGIGKSALMADVLRDFKDERHIFWYQMSDADTVGDILAKLSEFISQMGDLSLSSYLDSHDEPGLPEAAKVADKALRGKEVILAFDNYFNASEDVVDLFSYLCNMASKAKNLKLMLNAMDTTPFYCRFYDKSEVGARKIAEITIKGLDMEGSRQLLETPNIDPDALRKIHLMTRGHPLTLMLMKKGDVNSLKRIKGFTRQEASLLLYLKTVEKQ